MHNEIHFNLQQHMEEFKRGTLLLKGTAVEDCISKDINISENASLILC